MKVTGKHSLTLFQGTPNLVAVGSLKADGTFGQDIPTNIPAMPKDEDFHSFMFRHLSATIVGSGSWKASDFTNEEVLKAAVSLLKGKPAYTNHHISVGNEIGHIGEPKWSPATVNAANQVIPAGIDAPFVLDSILQPKLVRQLNSPVSPVTCCSVTVDFDWEASHEFEKEWDFYYHLGEVIDGSEVRRIATKITDFYESSLVWRGADPYAKMLDKTGKVAEVNINETAGDESYDAAARAETRQFFVVTGMRARSAASFNAPPKNQPTNAEQGSKNHMKIPALLFLAAALGKTVEEVQAFDEATLGSFKVVKTDEFTKLNADLTTANTSVTSLTTAKENAEKALETANTSVASLTKEKGELDLENKRLAPLAASGESYIKALRTSAEAQYTSFLKGKPADTTILDALKKDSVAELESKVKMWGGEVVASFAPTCAKCESSEHIAMRSTIAEPTPAGGGADDEEENLAQLLRR